MRIVYIEIQAEIMKKKRKKLLRNQSKEKHIRPAMGLVIYLHICEERGGEKWDQVRTIQEVGGDDKTAISKKPRECFKKVLMVNSDKRLREIIKSKV